MFQPTKKKLYGALPAIDSIDKEECNRNDPDQQPPVTPNQAAVYATTYMVYYSAIQAVKSVKDQGIRSLGDALKYSSQYLQKYPSLKTFIYTATALSVLPISVFSVFIGSSLIVSIITAAIGIMVVQSAAIAVGLSVLVPIEIGVLCIAAGSTILLRARGSHNKLLKGQPPATSKFSSCLLADGHAIDEHTTVIK
jgi:hypothetical protein